jgi:multidrug resistance efflux pump
LVPPSTSAIQATPPSELESRPLEFIPQPRGIPAPQAFDDRTGSSEDAIPRSRRADLTILVVSTGLLFAAVAIVINFFTARSRDAVINATPIVLSSPVSGTLTDLAVRPGMEVAAGQQLAMVVNPMARRDQLAALETELETATGRLRDLRARRDLQQKLVARLGRDVERQRALEIRRNRSDRDDIGFSLDRARKELAFARRETKRQEELFKAGAVAANVVDRARTTELQRARDVRGLESQWAGQSAVLQASINDLTLRNNRSGSDPVVRLQEATLALEKAEGELRTQGYQIEGLKRQLTVARREWQERNRALLISPRRAVVWQLEAQKGDSVTAQQKVVQLIDCNQRWLTTTVAESDLQRIRLGSKASISLLGSPQRLRGEVIAIRSGLGRVQLGEEAPVPVPINLARESQVKVRLLNDFPAPPGEFCYVGFSARVTFER